MPLCVAWALSGATGGVAAEGGRHVTGQGTTLTQLERGLVREEALHVLGGHANVVSRWNAGIRLLVIGGRDSGGARIARETVAEVVAQTGLALTMLGDAPAAVAPHLDAVRRSPDHRIFACERPEGPVCANFVVLLADVAAMRELADAVPLRAVYRRSLDAAGGKDAGRGQGDGVNCFFAPFQSPGREIVRAFVFVQDDLPPPMLRTCLQEEIYQAFGLFNDVSDSRFFSFDNRVEPKRITDFDRALLASVYAPDARLGDPVFAVVARFMRELAAEPVEPGPEAR